MVRLENKVAIITGAAMGIGEGVAKLFAREGAKVVVADVCEEEAKKVVSEIKTEGHEAIYVKFDVSKDEDWIKAMDATIDAMIGEAGLCAYCASKGSVRSLTKSAALHCGEMKYKIRVNSVHPGYVRTALTEKEAKDSGLSNEQYFIKVEKMHPIGHIGEPRDIACLDLYLASDESRWVTGSEYVIDGGYTAM